MLPMNVPSLTGVRGLAAVWVVLFHIQLFGAELGVKPLAGLPILRSGWTGVDLFFVLSGFVLMLVHEQDFSRLRWAPLARFAWLRFFRVYPLASVVLLLILLLTLLDPAFARAYRHSGVPPNFTVSSFFRTLSLATRWWSPTDGDWNQPVWSLSVEILGYAAFPFVAFFAGKVKQVWALLLIALACLYYPTFVAHFHANKTFNDDIFWGAGSRMAGAFTGGIVLARLHRLTPEAWRRAQGWVGDLGLVALLAALLVPGGVAYATICFGIIVYGIASGRGLANWLFGLPVSVWLGRISFPLYLIHVMALTWIRFNIENVPNPEWERLPGLGLYLVFCFAVAWLLHIWVERPTHNFARNAFPRPAATKPEGALAGRTANG